MEPSPKKPRFDTVTDDDVERMVAECVPENTRKTTEKWLRVFRNYLLEKEIQCDLTTVEPANLDVILAKFYAEVNQSDGSPYGQSSMLGCRAALHRHLRQSNRDFNIIGDKAFGHCNQVLDARLKKLKREGNLPAVRHKETITRGDFHSIMQYFGAHDGPVPLTEYVWFVLTYHFCLRGSESQAQLRVEDLQERTSDSGEAYYTLATAYKTKTDQGGLTSSNSVSDGLVQDPLLVAAVKKLLSKIDCKQTTRLFQMAKKHWEKDRDGLWFTGQPLGKNTIVHFMRDISKKANLSKVYTNHCVRATCISRLAEGGVSDHVIMATSGHRSVQSLASYHRLSEEMKKMKVSLLDESGTVCVAQPATATGSPVQVQPVPKFTFQIPTRTALRSLPPPAEPEDESAFLIDAILENATSQDLAELESSPQPQPIVINLNGASFQNLTNCTFSFTVVPQ